MASVQIHSDPLATEEDGSGRSNKALPLIVTATERKELTHGIS